eukprot:280440-Amorphochlora_amoeboformis.AAC.1
MIHIHCGHISDFHIRHPYTCAFKAIHDPWSSKIYTLKARQIRLRDHVASLNLSSSPPPQKSRPCNVSLNMPPIFPSLSLPPEPRKGRMPTPWGRLGVMRGGNCHRDKLE